MAPPSFLTLVVLLCSIAPSFAFIVLRAGKCPKVPTKPDFDLKKYLGLWYSLENFDVPYQYFNNDCVRAQYSMGDNEGEVNVLNRGRSRIKLVDGYRNVDTARAEGKAVIVDPNQPGGLSVSFGGMPGGLAGDGANYLIMDTDYNTYSLVYSCTELWIFKTEALWILVRSVDKNSPLYLSDSKREELLDLVKRYDIDPSYLREINHDQCYD